jgi:hypothetical protein
MKRAAFLVGPLGVLLALSGLAAPPNGRGTVGGHVLDQKDKPVAGIHVTLQDSEGGHLQTTETNAQGRFWIAFLPEGQYSVRASDQTRVSEWLKNVWVSPGRETDVTLHLHQKDRVASDDLGGPSQKVSYR